MLSAEFREFYKTLVLRKVQMVDVWVKRFQREAKTLRKIGVEANFVIFWLSAYGLSTCPRLN